MKKSQRTTSPAPRSDRRAERALGRAAGPDRVRRRAPRSPGVHDDRRTRCSARTRRSAARSRAWSFARSMHAAPAWSASSRDGVAIRDARAKGDGLFAVFLPEARRCRCAIACASLSPTARPGSAAIRIASCRRSATSTCTSSTRARIASSGRCSARTCARSTAYDGVALRGVGAERAARERGRRLLRLGRPQSSRCAGSAQSGVWELFIPGVGRRTRSTSSSCSRAKARSRVKTDPFALKMEQAPETASIVVSRTTRTTGATTPG